MSYIVVCNKAKNTSVSDYNVHCPFYTFLQFFGGDYGYMALHFLAISFKKSQIASKVLMTQKYRLIFF